MLFSVLDLSDFPEYNYGVGAGGCPCNHPKFAGYGCTAYQDLPDDARSRVQRNTPRFKKLYVRREIELARDASPEPIEANLHTLLDEAEWLEGGCSPEVSWVVGDVELEGVWIGNLQVNLALDEFIVHVSNLSVDTDDKDGYQHPHVGSDGTICWGDNETAAIAYHRAGDFLALKDLIDNLLRTYNAQSPYINLDEWVDGVGTACYECGERYSDDDLVWAEDVEGSLCDSCRSYCERCEQYVVYRHHDSDFEACEYCVADYTLECATCGEKFWEDDLESVEVPWFEQPAAVLLCEDCSAESEESEDNDEKFDDGAGLPGQIEIALASV